MKSRRRGLLWAALAAVSWIGAIVLVTVSIANRTGAPIGGGFLVIIAIGCSIATLLELQKTRRR
jgi:hypothetical protein